MSEPVVIPTSNGQQVVVVTSDKNTLVLRVQDAKGHNRAVAKFDFDGGQGRKLWNVIGGWLAR